MTVSASGTRKKTRKTAANGATCSHAGRWPESNRDDGSSAAGGDFAGSESPKPLVGRFSLIGMDIPSHSLILRSTRRARLEGWMHGTDARPSFETPCCARLLVRK